MTRTAACFAFVCLALPLAAAPAPADAAIVAAGKLADKANYSWTSAISNETNNGLTGMEGKTVRGGYTLITMRNPQGFLANRSVARDTDGNIPVYFHGNDRCVILTPDGWLTPEELPAAAQAGSTPNRNSGGRAGARGRASPSVVPDKVGDFTFEIRHPHEDLDLIVGSYATLRATGDSFTGELTGAGASLFLSSFAQPKVQVRRAAGSFHCWIENGVVVRYEVLISGTVNLPGDKVQLPVNWTIRTEIHDIGTTRLTVPAAARIKLE